jgi:hypothetical protein
VASSIFTEENGLWALSQISGFLVSDHCTYILKNGSLSFFFFFGSTVV